MSVRMMCRDFSIEVMMDALKRCARWGALLAVLVLSGLLLWTYYVPVLDGVDENGYLCTARRMVLRGTTVKHTAHPLEYVSENVVQTGEGTFYAKYPLGYPWLCAIAYRVGGPDAAFLVNPLLFLLSVAGVFFLGRALVNEFAGILAAILLATNPWHVVYALLAVSHTGSIAFSVWGMFFLWRWGTNGGRWNAALTGLLIGYAYTIRYTEALLIFPLLATVVWRKIHLPKEAAGQWWRDVGLIVVIGFLTILPLLLHHWVAFGAPWRTGYGLCGESTGFGWMWFKVNWWLMLKRLNEPGLFLIFPLGLAGLAYLSAQDRRRGWFLGMWAIPPILLYSSYYWAPENEGSMYARFFMTAFPALIVAGLALLCDRAKQRAGWTVAVGGLIAASALSNLRGATKEAGEQSDGLQAVRVMNDVVRQYAPDGSILVADGDPLNSLEYIGDYELYSFQTFDRNSLQWRVGFANPQLLDASIPHTFQLSKARFLESSVGRMNNRQLSDLQRSILSSNLAAGRSIYVVTSVSGIHNLRGQFGDAFHYRFLTEWYQISYTKAGVMQLWIQMLYRFESPDQRTPIAKGSLEDVEDNIDRLQFKLLTMHEEMRDQYADAYAVRNRISEEKRTLEALRETARKLAANKPKK